ncbi:MAG: TetR/AcrR family transcriptional regulator [Oceanicaulis sp.]
MSATASKKRRTQEERSREMRARLVEAAADCLIEEGYSNASVSRIVERAGVSRGAHLHHFPSKDLLIKAVCEDILKKIFRNAGKNALSAERPEDRFERLVRYWWDDVVYSRDGRLLLELMNAARTDEALASHLRPVAIKALRLFMHAGAHYFEPTDPKGPSVSELLHLVQWSLRGMLLDDPIVEQTAFFDKHIDALIALVGSRLVARKVSGPPPRIGDWKGEA